MLIALQLRRGIPVAHKLFGVPQTINTANYVYFLAYQQLSQLQSLAQPGANLLGIVNGKQDPILSQGKEREGRGEE